MKSYTLSAMFDHSLRWINTYHRVEDEQDPFSLVLLKADLLERSLLNSGSREGSIRGQSRIREDSRIRHIPLSSELPAYLRSGGRRVRLTGLAFGFERPWFYVYCRSSEG